MNWVDVVLIIFLVISVFSGIAQGLIRSLLSIVGLIFGIVLASNFYQQLGGALGFISNPDVANIVAFVIIQAAVLIAAAIVGALLKGLLKALMLGWADRLGGAVFGMFLGALSASAILAIVVQYTGTNLITGSAIAAFLLDKFPIILGFLPSEFDTIRDFFK